MAPRLATRSTVGAVAVALVLVTFLGAVVVLGPLAGRGAGASQSPTPSAPIIATSSGAATSVPTASLSASPSGSDAGSPSATPTLTPSAAPTISPRLPSLLGAIGDSYSQAYSVSPRYRGYDHTANSWVVGDAVGDHVYSLRERFEALGAALQVVDAAKSGTKMSDAPRQAAEIVARARGLKPGQTAYVTFELGTNDLCDDPNTSASTFEAQLRSAISILREGLPAGSRILLLPIPDFDHFHAITQADPAARASLAQHANSHNCAPFLGSNSPLDLDQARAALAEYDAILVRVCGEIQATDGAAGRLYCRTDRRLLSEGDFTIGDLSTVDYFHPSMSGQAKMATAAWNVGEWHAQRLPAGG